MCQSRLSRAIGLAVVASVQCLAGAFLPGATAFAQQLSIRHYDVSDGLAHSHVTAMHQDAKGYLWLATWEGLSRFDGYRFTNYGPREGLGDPIINAIAEDRQSRLWVATNGGGVARLIDDPQASSSDQGNTALSVAQRFVRFRVGDSEGSNRVNALLFDLKNNLWCATDHGLYRAATGQSGALKFEAIVPHRDVETGMAAFADRHGRLWFGIEHELIEIVGDQIIKYGPDDEVGRDEIESIIEDCEGRLLVANQREVFELIAPAEEQGRGRWRRYQLTFKPDQGINTMLGDSAGALWIGTWDGLVKYRDGKQTLYKSAQGLSDNNILSLAEDRDGNLWIGTVGGGVCKLSSELIISFTKTEGMPNQNVRKVIEDRQGRIYASVENGGLVEIVEEKAVPLTESQAPPFTDFNERILQDRRGHWWIGTDVGLFRFQGPELQLRGGRKFANADGIAEMSILGAPYQDPTGNVWISPSNRDLCHFDPAPNGRVVFEHIPSSALAPFAGAQWMISDRSGALWLGAHGLLGKLVNGRVITLQPTEGLPETNPRAFFLDSRGWLWIGLRYKGVSMTRDPTADTPKFVNYSTANGLASDAVWSITEDDSGRIYFGTGKGLDQLDLKTGRIRHFNTDDGLASDVINHCLKDRQGNIWVATSLGLSKFDPRTQRSADRPSPIYLSRVQVAGEELPLPETGARHVPELELPASRNNLLIEYVALSFRGEHKLRYQYKLEGVDADWSVPTEARSINYARLAASSYQFLARAIDQEGDVSDAATFRFRILPPLWQRWWFLTLVALTGGVAAYGLYRYRITRLVELERVRTRIATDLHDDLGSSLSQIAILSEVARQPLRGDDVQVTGSLAEIARISRETIDALSDIVWAINPERDQLRDLTQRMRHFASEVFTARNIEFQLHGFGAEPDIRLGANLRREVFLIFKEAVNNIVRHSGCTEAHIEFRLEKELLVLRLKDNGKGFDLTQASSGHGLGSMQGRARKMGGAVDLTSIRHQGTTVVLKLPLSRRYRSKWKRSLSE